jgi:cytochrome P450
MELLLVVAVLGIILAALPLVLYVIARKNLSQYVLVEDDGQPNKPKVMPSVDPFLSHLSLLFPSKTPHKNAAVLAHERMRPNLAEYRKAGMVNMYVFLKLRFISVLDPDLAKEVLAIRSEEVWQKPNFFKDFIRLTKDGVFLAQGEVWKQQRTVMSPVFRFEYLKGLIPSIQKQTNMLVEKWDSLLDQPIQLFPWLSSLTLDILGKTGFGYEFDALEGKANEALAHYETLARGSSDFRRVIPGYTLLPTKANRQMEESFQKFTSFILGIIEEKRAKLKQASSEKESGEENTETKNYDLLDLLIEAHDGESGYRMSDQELLHNVNTFFIAGHEATASSMAFALHFLATNPIEQKKVQKEIDQVLQGRFPSYDDLKQLQYLQMAIKETLRLLPPAPGVMRIAVKDTVLGGYKIFKGDTVSVSAYALHRLEDQWGENAEEFRPERFSAENSKGRHPMAWLPFGVGPRNCIGSHFAMLQMKVVLGTLLQRYTFKPNSATPFGTDVHFPMRPLKLFSLFVEKRK